MYKFNTASASKISERLDDIKVEIELGTWVFTPLVSRNCCCNGKSMCSEAKGGSSLHVPNLTTSPSITQQNLITHKTKQTAHLRACHTHAKCIYCHNLGNFAQRVCTIPPQSPILPGTQRWQKYFQINDNHDSFSPCPLTRNLYNSPTLPKTKPEDEGSSANKTSGR